MTIAKNGTISAPDIFDASVQATATPNATPKNVVGARRYRSNNTAARTANSVTPMSTVAKRPCASSVGQNPVSANAASAAMSSPVTSRTKLHTVKQSASKSAITGNRAMRRMRCQS